MLRYVISILVYKSPQVQNEESLLDRVSLYINQAKEYDLIKASNLDSPYSHKILSENCEMLRNTSKLHACSQQNFVRIRNKRFFGEFRKWFSKHVK